MDTSISRPLYASTTAVVHYHAVQSREEITVASLLDSSVEFEPFSNDECCGPFDPATGMLVHPESTISFWDGKDEANPDVEIRE